MSKTKDITPLQYAKWRGQHPTNISKHLRKGNPLPYVIRVKRFSRFYVLVVPKELSLEPQPHN